MTEAEMTKIFSTLMLAYPNAEMFKAPTRQALAEKLRPAIKFWTCCLHDVDFRVGQMAVVEVCRKCKYPPTIAEMLEEAQTILQQESQTERKRRNAERLRRKMSKGTDTTKSL